MSLMNWINKTCKRKRSVDNENQTKTDEPKEKKSKLEFPTLEVKAQWPGNLSFTNCMLPDCVCRTQCCRFWYVRVGELQQIGTTKDGPFVVEIVVSKDYMIRYTMKVGLNAASMFLFGRSPLHADYFADPSRRDLTGEQIVGSTCDTIYFAVPPTYESITIYNTFLTSSRGLALVAIGKINAFDLDRTNTELASRILAPCLPNLNSSLVRLVADYCFV